MANSRIARFFMEVAPPQYVSAVRRRTTKMMETITEEDREISLNYGVISPSKISSAISASSSAASTCASSTPSKISSAISASSSAASTCASSTNSSVNTRYFLKEVHRTLSSLNN